MATLEQKLKDIIAEDLQGEADLEVLDDGHVCGHVIFPLFEDKDYYDRRMMIRDAILKRVDKGELSSEEQGRISTLLTYTPDEWSVASTDTID